MSEVKKKAVDLGKKVDVTPLKDHEIHFNDVHHVLKQGKKTKVEEIFLQNLKTEKVIK